MALSTILAILALFIALVALWLVSDVLKRVENQNEKFVRAHISTIREELRETDRSIGKLTKAVAGLAETGVSIDKRINDHTSDIENVRQRIAKVAEGLDLLDRSIPQRGRLRVAVNESEAKTGVKAKPTVQ